MTEAAAIEAVRAVGGANWMQQAVPAQQTPDPDAVAAFSQAMGTPAVDGIPFVEQISETWKGAEVGLQKSIQKSVGLLGPSGNRMMSIGEFSRLQYEMSAASFQLEITTIVAKKVGEVVSTLVKNG